MSLRFLIFTVLSLATLFFVFLWAGIERSDATQDSHGLFRSGIPSWKHLAVGFATNFLDTLGIGSFATTTIIFKLGRMVPDEQIPGTMNIGHTLPTVLQAFLYMLSVKVDPKTLAILIGSAALGSWRGAGVVASLPRRSIQLGIGAALIVSVFFFVMAEFHWFPIGGERLALNGFALAAAALVVFLLGALSTLGVGFYAPCMVLVSVLGMAPLATFPIMMGSSALLMPVGSSRFLLSRAYASRAALGLALGGLPAVLIAGLLVTSLPVDILRRMVILVALWAAFSLFRSAYVERVQENPTRGSAT